MSKYHCYRINILSSCVILAVLIFCQNAFCTHAILQPLSEESNRYEQGQEHAQEAMDLLPIQHNIVQVNQQPVQQRQCCLEGPANRRRLYGLSLGIFLLLCTAIAVPIALSHGNGSDAQQSSQSFWQEDGCPRGCTAAFSASGLLVNTSSSNYGHWAPWVVGCNGAAHSPWHCDQWQSGRVLSLCMEPYPYPEAPDDYYKMWHRPRWNPDTVTKENMIARISAYCKAYEHISFCHCPDDPEEGYCARDPLDIVSYMAEFTRCYPPPAISVNQKNNARKTSKKVSYVNGTLKERLKTQGHTNLRDFKNKNRCGNHTIKQPQHRAKR